MVASEDTTVRTVSIDLPGAFPGEARDVVIQY